jgi:hypothetical protein
MALNSCVEPLRQAISVPLFGRLPQEMRLGPSFDDSRLDSIAAIPIGFNATMFRGTFGHERGTGESATPPSCPDLFLPSTAQLPEAILHMFTCPRMLRSSEQSPARSEMLCGLTSLWHHRRSAGL